MLKSRISYAIQNSACQIVGWKPKAADPTFQCCSLVSKLAGLESGTLLIVNVSKFNLSLSACTVLTTSDVKEQHTGQTQRFFGS